MEFEVPLEKATEIRRWAEKEGAELLRPEAPGAFISLHRTIQVINTEPLVVSFSRYEDLDIGATPNNSIMRITTSDKIAQQEGFQKIISPDSQSKPERPRFNLNPVPLDRSKLPSREEVEKSFEKVRRDSKKN
ncbi:MAG: hypothetical protein WCV81_05430 [Microgenomates group bacterium]|jgi:hypothetical protein